MDDDISKGLGGLMGVLSPDQERMEQQKARNEVAKKLGLSHIPDPNEIVPSESDTPFNDSIYKAPALDIPKKDPVDPYSKEEIKKDILKIERENIISLVIHTNSKSLSCKISNDFIYRKTL